MDSEIARVLTFSLSSTIERSLQLKKKIYMHIFCVHLFITQTSIPHIHLTSLTPFFPSSPQGKTNLVKSLKNKTNYKKFSYAISKCLQTHLLILSLPLLQCDIIAILPKSIPFKCSLHSIISFFIQESCSRKPLSPT